MIAVRPVPCVNAAPILRSPVLALSAEFLSVFFYPSARPDLLRGLDLLPILLFPFGRISGDLGSIEPSPLVIYGKLSGLVAPIPIGDSLVSLSWISGLPSFVVLLVLLWIKASFDAIVMARLADVELPVFVATIVVELSEGFNGLAVAALLDCFQRGCPLLFLTPTSCCSPNRYHIRLT